MPRCFAVGGIISASNKEFGSILPLAAARCCQVFAWCSARSLGAVPSTEVSSEPEVPLLPHVGVTRRAASEAWTQECHKLLILTVDFSGYVWDTLEWGKCFCCFSLHPAAAARMQWGQGAHRICYWISPGLTLGTVGLKGMSLIQMPQSTAQLQSKEWSFAIVLKTMLSSWPQPMVQGITILHGIFCLGSRTDR